MSERYPRVGRTAGSRRDAGDNLKSDAGLGERFDFLSTATKNKRVTPFKTQNLLAFFRKSHQHTIEIFLRHCMV